MTDDEKLAEYLSRGGTVTRCPPGPSENIVYRNRQQFRRRQHTAGGPEGEQKAKDS
ncbi:MAG TPA: hypothetical protein HPQ04_14520 [Rhodospirillaceae bacterium]|nr:hypothetical protein [Rhodospirillaceae bacterium]